MMLCLHLFNSLDYEGLFAPLLYIGSKPLIYYVSLFCDACVPIFAFVSGYGLYFKYLQNQTIYRKDNLRRLKKMYLNYWIIIFLFPVGLGFLLGEENYPGSIIKLLGNLSAVVTSYNGAWWFFTIYVLFVLTSHFWFRLFDTINPYLFLISLFVLYVIGFYFRIYKVPIYNNNVANHIQTQVVLYICTLFQFMLGAFALRFSWNNKISQLINLINNKNLLFIGGTIMLIVLHGIVPNFIIAPFTGIIFLFLFLQLELKPILNRILDFFTPHSTNIWLVHMFFYMIFFKSFIYSTKYVLPIFLLLVFCCIGSSVVINKILDYNSRLWNE
ncbi:hypothetical protein FBGL_13710 [Flavobacterium glycines]|nr:hypothetical protein FBGL_13710 [Flavobacterium glycines]